MTNVGPPMFTLLIGIQRWQHFSMNPAARLTPIDCWKLTSPYVSGLSGSMQRVCIRRRTIRVDLLLACFCSSPRYENFHHIWVVGVRRPEYRFVARTAPQIGQNRLPYGSGKGSWIFERHVVHKCNLNQAQREFNHLSSLQRGDGGEPSWSLLGSFRRGREIRR